MGFVDRAKSMHARGDIVRAAVILAQGLKREPRDSEAVGWLLHLYVEELPNPGIESDVLQVLALQPNGADLLAIVRAELDELGSADKLKAIDKTLHHSPMRFASAGPPQRDTPGESDSQPRVAEEPRSELVPPNEQARDGENWSSFDSPFDHTGRVELPPEEAEAKEPEAEEPAAERPPRLEAPEREPQVADSDLSASIDLALSQPLGAIEHLPGSIKREYLPDEASSSPGVPPMVWAVIAGVALLCLAAIVGYATKSSEVLPEEPPPEWAPVLEPSEEVAPDPAAELQVDPSAEASAEDEGSGSESDFIEAPTDGDGE